MLYGLLGPRLGGLESRNSRGTEANIFLPKPHASNLAREGEKRPRNMKVWGEGGRRRGLCLPG